MGMGMGMGMGTGTAKGAKTFLFFYDHSALPQGRCTVTEAPSLSKNGFGGFYLQGE